MLVLPALMLLALAAMPFLHRDVAASVLTEEAAVVLILLGVIDVLTLKVPNILMYPSIAFALAATAIIDPSLLDNALIGGGALLGVMFLLALIGRGSLGMGDVKFACFTGCILGWRIGLVALASGFVIGAGAALVLLVLRMKGRKDSIPLTPFLAMGALVWIFLAGTLAS
jgi:leader peptidase (prepilin peptidase)/N-methyltransferase